MTDRTGLVLGQINLVTDDMPAMAEFYRRLGVDFPEAGPPEWVAHHRNADLAGDVGLDLDSGAFAETWNAGWTRGRTGPVIGFRLSDREGVDRTYAELVSAGYRGEQEPYDTFWGSRYALVADPDGNSVGLMSPSDPERRTAPPPPPR